MKVFEYHLVDGHIIFDMDGKRVLLDTGAPTSVGEIGRFNFLGQTFQLYPSFLGVNLAYLSENIGTDIDILMGSDLIGCFDCIIDSTASSVTFGKNLPDFQSKTSSESFMNVPIILCSTDGRQVRMFFDTGARLSYLDPEIAEKGEPTGEEQDFYPQLGKFSTKTYITPIKIADELIYLKVGILPQLLQATLRMANVSGIIGTAILENFKVCLSIPRKRLSLRRLEPIERDREFIKAIYEDRLPVTSHQEALEVMSRLINLAFRGFFLDSHNLRGFGSPLPTMICEKVRECEAITKTDFFELARRMGKDKPYVEWVRFFNSSGFLLIPSFREKTIAFVNPEPIRIDLKEPLSDRFKRYLEKPEHRKSFAKYFGKRLKEEEREEFRRLFGALEDDLKKELLDIFKASSRRRPFWKRFVNNLS